MTAPSEVQGPGLRRDLGLWGATLSGVGIILGAGIYVLIGRAAGDAGGAVWVSFLIGALLAGATGLSYAELASMYPEAGGSASYARAAFGRRAGFLVGWLLEAMAILAAAAVAIGFGHYAHDLLAVPPRWAAVALLLGMGVVVWYGIRETVALTVTFTLIEAIGLVVVIVTGAPFIDVAVLTDAPAGLGGIVTAAALVFFAFTGFEQIVTLSEETRDPTRTIPRAMLLAIGLTAGLYVTVSVVAVSVVPWSELATSEAPLADVVALAGGVRLGGAVAVIALFATANTVLLLLATGARLAWGMARHNLLPAVFSRVDPRRQTPHVATVAVTLIAALFALSDDIGQVAQLTNFTLFIAFISVNAAVIRLRRAVPDHPRPFRVPAALGGIPVTSAIGGAAALVLLLRLDPSVLLGGAVLTVIGLLASLAAIRGQTSALPAGVRRA